MKRIVTAAEHAKALRQRYIFNPPEGMTSNEVRDMSTMTFWTWIFSFMNLMIVSSNIHAAIQGFRQMNLYDHSNHRYVEGLRSVTNVRQQAHHKRTAVKKSSCSFSHLEFVKNYKKSEFPAPKAIPVTSRHIIILHSQ